jgi:hypothetical protein
VRVKHGHQTSSHHSDYPVSYVTIIASRDSNTRVCQYISINESIVYTMFLQEGSRYLINVEIKKGYENLNPTKHIRGYILAASSHLSV